MANKKHLNILKQGVSVWNEWRKKNKNVRPDLSGANLSKADLSKADLSGADLSGAILVGENLSGADLSGAILVGENLSGADLSGAILVGANLYGANLSKADLSKAILSKANLSGANLYEADLSGADLSGAILVRTNLSKAILKNCFIYGISAWDLNLEGAIQSDLIITPDEKEFTITVDNLEVAQFIYLLLYNEKIRQVIDTITSKVVLILGRFTEERKKILDAIREKLREYNYIPILFDFEEPQSRDIIETIRLLAHMSRCVIADITWARTGSQELQSFVEGLKIPIALILEKGKDVVYGGAEHFKGYPWVSKPFEYENPEQLLNSLDKLIKSAEEFKEKSILAIEKVKEEILRNLISKVKST
jgi:hypothetical protein